MDDVFSGDDNFFLAFGSGSNPSVLVDRLGERYEVTRTNIKKWTVGSPIQAPLDALALGSDFLRPRACFQLAQVGF